MRRIGEELKEQGPRYQGGGAGWALAYENLRNIRYRGCTALRSLFVSWNFLCVCSSLEVNI